MQHKVYPTLFTNLSMEMSPVDASHHPQLALYVILIISEKPTVRSVCKKSLTTLNVVALLAVGFTDPLKMELLQFATLLIRRAAPQLVNHRKELIKFGWNHLKRDDSACKYYAFLNVCHFLEAYQAPEKIVLQVCLVTDETTWTFSNLMRVAACYWAAPAAAVIKFASTLALLYVRNGRQSYLMLRLHPYSLLPRNSHITSRKAATAAILLLGNPADKNMRLDP